MTSIRNLGLGAALVLACGAGVVLAQGITIPYTFTTGTVADATQVNANFSALAAKALNRTGGTMTGTLTARAVAASADATYDVGASDVRFRNAYFSGTVTAAGFSNSSGSPTGAVMFFNLSACPDGWTEFTSARGRYVVGKPSAGTLAATAGTALTDLENRPAGSHTHPVTLTTASGGTPDGATVRWSTFSTVGGSLTVTTSATSGAVAGTNAPYVQLLACVKS